MLLLPRRLFLTPLPALAAPAKPKSKGPPPPPPGPVQWKPRPLFNGAPVLFRSKTISGPATWMGKQIEFRREGEIFTALAGIDLSTKPGRYPLQAGDETVQVYIGSKPYPSSAIRVAPQFIDPPKEVQQRIDEEKAVKQKAFAASPAGERRWQGSFAPPTKTQMTSPFGSKRVYNGKTRSVHQGLDFGAATGTVITASNHGRVAIAREMYFEGGFVLLDHGESIFTLYMHLSEFLVKEGALVEKGHPIAKSGASGRVTGPHLHFAVCWQGSYLEPRTLLAM